MVLGNDPCFFIEQQAQLDQLQGMVQALYDNNVGI
jgi:hypothetical protein